MNFVIRTERRIEIPLNFIHKGTADFFALFLENILACRLQNIPLSNFALPMSTAITSCLFAYTEHRICLCSRNYISFVNNPVSATLLRRQAASSTLPPTCTYTRSDCSLKIF